MTLKLTYMYVMLAVLHSFCMDVVASGEFTINDTDVATCVEMTPPAAPAARRATAKSTSTGRVVPVSGTPRTGSAKKSDKSTPRQVMTSAQSRAKKGKRRSGSRRDDVSSEDEDDTTPSRLTGREVNNLLLSRACQERQVSMVSLCFDDDCNM